jgi:aromatic ring-opening dioxygenase catalytic subunit (LigB family)
MQEHEEEYRELRKYFDSLLANLPTPPRAALVITAHWEEREATLSASPNPPMLYDYSGFPPETMQVQWPAPGSPELVAEVEELLSASGIAHKRDEERGFDHGTFVPLSLIDPEAKLPTVQLSVLRRFDPEQHLRLGEALAPLRKRGVLIIGSGMSYHNMSAFFAHMRGGPSPMQESIVFDDWLWESAQLAKPERHKAFINWAKAPAARASHPREEHLMPLHVIVGAAGDSAVSLDFRGPILGAQVSALRFG